jgi:deoxyribodipyrimidine photolyase-related protein
MIIENQFNHNNFLPNSWYTGTTNIYPIDFLINKVKIYAYAHHIERLMILGNFALLNKIRPLDIYNWFMICFIDSYEWVMVPNIFGMSQYSTSIKIVTRPYFSSSNYIIKMSNFKKNNYDIIYINNISYYWNDIWDVLYYSFLNDNSNILKHIYMISTLVNKWNIKPIKEKNNIIKISNFLNKN